MCILYLLSTCLWNPLDVVESFDRFNVANAPIAATHCQGAVSFPKVAIDEVVTFLATDLLGLYQRPMGPEYCSHDQGDLASIYFTSYAANDDATSSAADLVLLQVQGKVLITLFSLVGNSTCESLDVNEWVCSTGYQQVDFVNGAVQRFTNILSMSTLGNFILAVQPEPIGNVDDNFAVSFTGLRLDTPACQVATDLTVLPINGVGTTAGVQYRGIPAFIQGNNNQDLWSQFFYPVVYWYRFVPATELFVESTTLSIRIEDWREGDDLSLLRVVLFQSVGSDPSSCQLLVQPFDKENPSLGSYEWLGRIDATYYVAIYRSDQPLPADFSFSIRALENPCQEATTVVPSTTGVDIWYSSADTTALYRPLPDPAGACDVPVERVVGPSRVFTYSIAPTDGGVNALLVETNSPREEFVQIYVSDGDSSPICNLDVSEWLCADFSSSSTGSGVLSASIAQYFLVLGVQAGDSFAITVEQDLSDDTDISPFTLQLVELRDDINPCEVAIDLTSDDILDTPIEVQGDTKFGAFFNQFPGWEDGTVAVWYKISAPLSSSSTSFLVRIASPDVVVSVDSFRGSGTDDCSLLPMGPTKTLEDDGGITWVHPADNNAIYYLAVYSCCGRVAGPYDLQLEAGILCDEIRTRSVTVLSQFLVYNPGEAPLPKPYDFPDCSSISHTQVNKPGDLATVYKITTSQAGTLVLQAAQRTDPTIPIRAALYRGDACDDTLECIGGYESDATATDSAYGDSMALRFSVEANEIFHVALFHTPVGRTQAERSVTFAAEILIEEEDSPVSPSRGVSTMRIGTQAAGKAPSSVTFPSMAFKKVGHGPALCQSDQPRDSLVTGSMGRIDSNNSSTLTQ
eukprot:scaffold5017_cov171-Amphora_coffeaeformis.AAC.28